MPGINLLVSSRRVGAALKSEFQAAQQGALARSGYRSRVIFADGNVCGGVTAYQEYPFKEFEFEDYQIIVEGEIYNKDFSSVRSELSEIARRLDQDGKNASGLVREWILGTDGDYLILIRRRKKQNIFIFNDVLGRLPLYFSQIGGDCLISRQLKFINHFSPEVAFDRDALGENLLFGFPLGDRTPFKNTFRLFPGSLVSIRTSPPSMEVTGIHRFNLDQKTQAGMSLEVLSRELKNRFVTACRNRGRIGEKTRNVVALSGGLDSRAVALGLKEARVPFSAATFLDSGRDRAADVALARKVAEELGIEWRLFQVKEPDLEEARDLVDLKDGSCNIGLSIILDFFRQLREVYGGRLTHFTGDEGNILVPDMRPPQRLRTTGDLVEGIISNNALFDPEEVETLLKLPPGQLRELVKNRVEAYPERDLNQKFVHFVIFEHCFKLQFEAEDRNRCFFWTAAPFYSVSVFNFLMNIPDREKRFYRLYKKFLEDLSPECAAIDNVGSLKVPLHSSRRYFYLVLRDLFSLLPPALKLLIRKKTRRPYQPEKINPAILDYALGLLSRSPLCARVLDVDRARRLLKGKCDKVQFDTLATVILYLDRLGTVL